MVFSYNLGFPRIGRNRELKKSLESYWSGKVGLIELQNTAKSIRKENWELQKSSGLNYIPSNDFSYYDQVLDMTFLLGAIPERFGEARLEFDDLYFATARGLQKGNIDLKAMEMTKWFDTNYHYIVPELSKNQKFSLYSTKIFDEYQEAKVLGIETRPVLIAPVTYLSLSKTTDGSDALELLDNLLPVYSEVLVKLKKLGVKDIQIDEPILSMDINNEQALAIKKSFAFIKDLCGNDIKMHLVTYFDGIYDNKELAFGLDVDSVHLDLVRAEDQLNEILPLVGNKSLSLGLVNGRNIWINNLENSIKIANEAIKKLGSNKVIIGPSCSMIHSPIDLESETNLDEDIKTWLSFATQKLNEIQIIKSKLNGDSSFDDQISANRKAIESRKNSAKINVKEVQNRVNSLNESFLNRRSEFSKRKIAQQKSLNLPLFPTTTIGSFPQTPEIRKIRAEFKAGKITDSVYNEALKNETKNTIKIQEEIGLDVLVHGEYERNDMVEYFGEQLGGFTFTKNGWVQSYGSRCVKPPVIFGDVYRKSQMTVDWSSYAQSLTKKYMKGMLTGPVTILQWSFVRDDQPRSTTTKQIALAIRDEVVDLEAAGIKIIQIDEPAIREGLPIRRAKWNDYLKWSVDSFRISASGVRDETQIHTHMCYSEFNHIIKNVADMDADVISIEASRSNMELLSAFTKFKYPNEIGPGMYDIHSPRVPSVDEMQNLIMKILDYLEPEQIWINPDCGLKTRGWSEVKIALANMVKATESVRNSSNVSKKPKFA